MKCVSYNCNSVRNNSEIVKAILKDNDMIFLQELMLNKSDLPLLDEFNENFIHIAFVKDRESEGINEGRPTKGVAIFWRKELASFISPVLVNNFIIGVILKCNNFNVLFLNVYLPCDKQTLDSLDEYRNALSSLSIVVEEQNVNEVVIVGDLNADPSKGRFWNDLSVFCRTNSLLILDEKLPMDTFTYLCPAKNTTSWLDHILCTKQAIDHIGDMYIDYGLAIYDHFPLCFSYKFSFISNNLHRELISTDEFVDWNRISKSMENRIKEELDALIISNGLLFSDLFCCFNINCRDPHHKHMIDVTFEEMKAMLIKSTEEYRFAVKKRYKVVPGWNDFVKPYYNAARDCFLKWFENGKPPNGVLIEEMKASRANFRYALKKCKENEENIRKEKLTEKLKEKRYKDFWRDVHNINKQKSVQHDNIEHENNPFIICNLFSDKYKKIFNNCKSKVSKLKLNEKQRTSILLRFSIGDIRNAISCLKPTIGYDNIHANHLKICSTLFMELISNIFTSFIIHNYVPVEMLKGIITPIIKDRYGDLSKIDNYRPIMSSPVSLKVFEYCLLDKISPYIALNDRQHGFRDNYSTSTACWVLKETVLNYTKSKSDVYACFIDLSKAFDSVNHEILIGRLHDIGIPDILVDIISFWYNNQWASVKFKSSLSPEWRICNGVRQGGVLSALFFSIYIDPLIDSVSSSNFGCSLGLLKSNIIVYADDLVVLAPSAKALQILINIILVTASSLDLKVNEDKTKCMIFKHGKYCNDWNNVPSFTIDQKQIECVSSYKYLGYIIVNDLSIKEDVSRALNKFYSDINMILRKFSYADKEVKLYLFKQYCLQIYGAEFWWRDLSSRSSAILKQFSVSYHKSIKKLLQLSSHESNHYACQEAQLLTFQHFINKLKIMAVIRLFSKPCAFIRKIEDHMYISSFLLSEVSNILKTDYDVDTVFENDRDAIYSRICFVQNHEKQMRMSW